MGDKFQIKDNYTQTPDVYFDSIMRTLSDGEWKVLCVIIRKTIGFAKLTDGIAMSQILAITGYTQRKSVLRVRASLAAKGLISYTQSAGGTKESCTEYTIILPEGVSLTPVVDKTRVSQTTDTGVLNDLTRVSQTTPTIDNSYNKQITTHNTRDAHPFDKPELKTGASPLCIEAMTAYNIHIAKRPKAAPDPIHWTMWVDLCGDEQAVFEAIMGIVQSQALPERYRPNPVYRLDNLFREQHTVTFWRSHYKSNTQQNWWSGLSEEAIIDRITSLLRYRIEVPQEVQKWIPQAQQRLNERLAV